MRLSYEPEECASLIGELVHNDVSELLSNVVLSEPELNRRAAEIILTPPREIWRPPRRKLGRCGETRTAIGSSTGATADPSLEWG